MVWVDSGTETTQDSTHRTLMNTNPENLVGVFTMGIAMLLVVGRL